MRSFLKLNLIISILILSTNVFCQIPGEQVQIYSAVLAAPEDMREGASVLGYNSEGELVMLKEGTNDLICLADNPEQNGFNVACYQKELEPFMTRGRGLRIEGKTREEIFKIRENEVQSGDLKMPASGATLSIYFGPEEGYNKETGEVTNASYRYVVYVPYSTAESTGLSLKPEFPGGPWLMDPGTHRAHIMITPLPKDQ